MKKLNKKGFTLVEIVIVIVIIAILAAMLIPALTKWIDKSRQKTFLNNCDTIKTAVATAMSEAYANNSHVKTIGDAVSAHGINDKEALTKSVGKEVRIVGNDELAANDETVFRVDTNSWADDIAISDGKYSVQWANGQWTSIKNLDKTGDQAVPYKVSSSQTDNEN